MLQLVRVARGEALPLASGLACFLGGATPFGRLGKVLPVVLDLMIPQGPNPGLNLLGANQHLLTAIWGLFLLAGLDIRTRVARPRPRP